MKCVNPVCDGHGYPVRLGWSMVSFEINKSASQQSVVSGRSGPVFSLKRWDFLTTLPFISDNIYVKVYFRVVM